MEFYRGSFLWRFNQLKRDELIRELKTYTFLFRKKPKKLKKFVIFSTPRSGSNLLGDLLSQHPQVTYTHELFNLEKKVHLSPYFYVNSICRLCKTRVYSFKIPTDQLKNPVYFRHYKTDCKKFMKKMHKMGWKIINLTRKNSFHQAVSWIKAENHRVWRTKDKKYKSESIQIKFEELNKWIEKFEKFNDFHSEVLKGIPHLNLFYETDLSNSKMHQKTADKVFDYLGIPSDKVNADYIKQSRGDISKEISNYNEIKNKLVKTRFAKYLDK